MSVSSPPAAQSARNANSFGTLAAAIGGVLKMPMPTTVPTSMALACRTDSVGRACAAGARALVPPARCTARCEPDCETGRSEEHTSELQSRENLVCRLLLEKKKK